MALLLDDDAARSAGECSHRHAIGERGGGHEDGALFSEQPRALRLELLDDAAERIGVRGEARCLDQLIQQRGVLPGRQAQAVAAQPHRPIAAIVDGFAKRKARQACDDARCKAADSNQLPAIDASHHVRLRMSAPIAQCSALGSTTTCLIRCRFHV